MFVRLTGANRLRAGRLVALVYMLCVLAPSLSFALPGSHAVSPCLTDAGQVLGIMHVHADAPAIHLHGDGQMHDRAPARSHASPSDSVAAIKALAAPGQNPSKGSHSSQGQCCGLTCLFAIPAALLEMATPSEPTATQVAEGCHEVADNAPSRHYRPPIS